MFALLKQVRTPPVRPADGVVECVYESFVPGEDYRGLGLRGRTLSRPLSASVCGKYVVAATRPSPFKVGDNQRPERTMSGAAKTPPESSVPVGGWSWRGNPAGMNCCGDRLHSLECASEC